MVVTPNNSGIGSVRATLRNIIGQLSGDQWRRFSFYVGVPLLLGVYGAMNNFHDVQSVGHVSYLMFYLGHAMIPFWISCLSTQLVTIVLAPWRWPLTVRLIIGGALGSLIVLPYASWLAQSGPPADASAAAFSVLSQEFFIYSVRATLIWVGINLLFDRFLGLPRYRYPAVDIPRVSAIESSDATDASVRPAIVDAVDYEVGNSPAAAFPLPAVLQLAPVPLQPDDLMAMEAQEHYVNLVTKRGAFLVYHRFADALKEVKILPGVRVHRSHWVAEDAIALVERSAKKMFVEVRDSGRIPVSRPYQAMVLDVAERRKIPVRGGGLN